MHRIILACRAHQNAEIIPHAHRLGITMFDTKFTPQLARTFPPHSTVYLKLTTADAGEVEFQTRTFKASLHPSIRLVLMFQDPEFQTVDLKAKLNAFVTTSAKLSRAGVLDSFGVSSNGLAKHRLSLTLLRDFTHIQFPFNLMETAGEELFSKLEPHQKLSTDRSLTAFDETSSVSYRFVDAEFPLGYPRALEELLAHIEGDSEGSVWLKNLFSQLDEQVSKFSSVLHWERELETVILPMIDEKFEELDGDTVRLMTSYFHELGLAVKESGGVQARQRLEQEGIRVNQHQNMDSLQEEAFVFVLKNHSGGVSIHASSVDHVNDYARWIAKHTIS